MFSRLRQLLRRGRGQEGAAAVEFAAVVPLLLILLAGFFDFGWLFYWQHTVTNASRAGARYGVQANYPLGVRTPHTDAEIQAMVKNNYGADLGVTVVPGSIAGTPLSVTVEKTMDYLFLDFLRDYHPYGGAGVVLPGKVGNKTTMTME